MAGTATMNALRSAVVVVGALAFGYLTLMYGCKPFFEPYLKQESEEDTPQQPIIFRLSETKDKFDD